MLIRLKEVIVNSEGKLEAQPAIFEFSGLNYNDKGQVVLRSGDEKYTVVSEGTTKVVSDITRAVQVGAGCLLLDELYTVRSYKKGDVWEDVYCTRYTSDFTPLSKYLYCKSKPVEELIKKQDDSTKESEYIPNNYPELKPLFFE